MRRPLIAGNWKMHGTKQSVAMLLHELVAGLSQIVNAELAVFPPFVFLEQAQKILNETSIALGAQNVCDSLAGAFTGEVSAAMLVEYACQYVIVGHSERRSLYAESDELVAAKFFSALQNQLTPILCVGETLQQREQNLTLEVVQQQLAVVLSLADNCPTLTKAVIAYEPLWAIGTGKTATPEQAQQVHAAIREQLIACDAEFANIRIVYGGSVNPENANELFAMPDIDGALVGGASLDAGKFLAIGKQCNN